MISGERMAPVRFAQPLAELSLEDTRALLRRAFSIDASVSATVAEIISAVCRDGDTALHALAAQYDGAQLKTLLIPREACEAAFRGIGHRLCGALERAKRNLERVARATLPHAMSLEVEPGLVVGRRMEPLARIGVYAPGGRASYPSSVLMGAVPARVAGVGHIILCSPPGPDGLPPSPILAAAHLCGIDQVFAVGGAGAIAAMAYGTASIARVDRVVGPGNAYVAEAKRQVAGIVGIDSPAGPTELVVVADSSADAEVVAREMLAQAEHDADACCVALCEGEALWRRVLARVTELAPLQHRRHIVTSALAQRGAVLQIDSLDAAWPFVTDFAPEHLLLCGRRAERGLDAVRNAGTIFVGSTSSVAFGDYLTGANHVLPTAGAARRFAGLSVLDFVRMATWQHITPRAAASLAEDTEALAELEGLPAHAQTAKQWAEIHDDDVAIPLARRTLAGVQLYRPKGTTCAIDLSDNTNLFGVAPEVAQMLCNPDARAVSRYPTPYGDLMKQALAKMTGLAPHCLVTGTGSDGVLQDIFRAFGEAGAMLAYCPPTFGVIPAFALAHDYAPVAFPLDVQALARSPAKLIYLCTPNNPTGSALPDGFVEALLDETGALVVVDEAYQEFCSRPSQLGRAAIHGRLIVTRTMSKAYGLAGLRVGWAIGHPSLVANIERARGPYRVSALAEAAAVLALGAGRRWMESTAREATASRFRLGKELQKRGYRPRPSEANFLLLPVQGSASDWAHALADRDVAVRPFPNLEGVGEAIRVTVGPWPLMADFLQAFDSVTLGSAFHLSPDSATLRTPVRLRESNF